MSSSATFWWISLFAKRVSALSVRMTSASACEAPALERHRHGALGDREPVGSAHRAPTPTWTSRKRAPLQPCPTCMPWPGWPLPQFVMPTSIHVLASATASQERQNSGVMPVYVALR